MDFFSSSRQATEAVAYFSPLSERGRHGSIHHVSGCEVDVGGEGPIFRYIRAKLESEFLTGQDE